MNSRWIIPFRKIRLSKLTLQGGRNLINFIYYQEKQKKIDCEFQQLFKANTILLANTPTPHLAQKSEP